MPPLIRKLKRLNSYRSLLSSDETTPYSVEHVMTAAQLHQAKKLHAQVYIERDYITLDHLDKDGHYAIEHDPYQSHADYFVVTRTVDQTPTTVATARLIYHVKRARYEPFPTLGHMTLYEDKHALLSRFRPADCVEVSALAKLRGESPLATLTLYRAMWHYSLGQHHKLWLMACDARVYRQLKLLFGDALVQIGPEAHYLGSVVVPAALEVDRSLAIVAAATRTLNPLQRSVRRSLLKFFAHGLPLLMIDTTHHGAS